MKDSMWEEKSIRAENMSLEFKEKMHSKQISFFNLLPKRLKAINILLEAHIFIISYNCKVLLWSA